MGVCDFHTLSTKGWNNHCLNKMKNLLRSEISFKDTLLAMFAILVYRGILNFLNVY